MTDHYETLGVDRDADPESLKAAYRRRAAETHPDKGGDREEFEAVALAYDTLTDEARRRYYDHGEEPPPSEMRIRMEAVQLITMQFIAEIGQTANVCTTDLLEGVRAFMDKGVEMTDAELEAIEARRLLLRDVAKRLHCEGEDDFLGNAIKAEFDTLDLQQDQNDQRRKVIGAAVEILETYSYQVDKNPGMTINDLLRAGAMPAGSWIDIS